jgi:hypothetical protein
MPSRPRLENYRCNAPSQILISRQPPATQHIPKWFACTYVKSTYFTLLRPRSQMPCSPTGSRSCWALEDKTGPRARSLAALAAFSLCCRRRWSTHRFPIYARGQKVQFRRTIVANLFPGIDLNCSRETPPQSALSCEERCTIEIEMALTDFLHHALDY